MIRCGNKKRLIYTGMIEVMSDSPYQRSHYLKRCQMSADLKINKFYKKPIKLNHIIAKLFLKEARIRLFILPRVKLNNNTYT